MLFYNFKYFFIFSFFSFFLFTFFLFYKLCLFIFNFFVFKYFSIFGRQKKMNKPKFQLLLSSKKCGVGVESNSSLSPLPVNDCFSIPFGNVRYKNSYVRIFRASFFQYDATVDENRTEIFNASSFSCYMISVSLYGDVFHFIIFSTP